MTEVDHMTKEIAAQMGGNEALNYYTHISENDGFVYFGVPNACYFRTLATLNTAVAANQGQAHKYAAHNEVYQRKFGVLESPWDVEYAVFDDMLDDPDTLKLAFVRDPETRFLAAYHGKLTRKTRNSAPRKKLFEMLGLTPGQDLSLADLTGVMLEEPSLREGFPFFRPQRNLIAFDLVEFGFIGNHTTWDADILTLGQQIFGQTITKIDPISEFNRDEDGVNHPTEIDDQSRMNIQKIYAQDFDMLEEIKGMFPA